MLDEVDASLDDTNVLRFCKLVKEMSNEVQFIFISHNKVAIEMAHHLAGVTMHEPGISRMVNVDLEKGHRYGQGTPIMDIDYLLIILPSIIFLGAFSLILIIWHGNFRSKKEKINLNTNDSITKPYSKAEPPTSRFEPTLTKSNFKETTNHSNSAAQYDIGNYIILQLMHPLQRPFQGYELIQTLTSTGFHYGKMNIFHFYADPLNKKELLFSLASAIKPRTFDLDNIGEIVCPGLCLFMSIHKVKSAVTVFDLMWETIQTLAQDLDGILCDTQLQPINNLNCYYDQAMGLLAARRENETTGVYEHNT